MASEKNLKLKRGIVEEIKNKLDKNKTFLLLDYQGLTVSEFDALRKSLRETGSDIKIYKNSLMDLALKDKQIPLNEYMSGPNAYLFSDAIIEPIKVVSKFAKDHPALEIRVGYVDNEVIGKDIIDQYASIPSLEGLWTMFAGGLMQHVKNLSIALNMYANKLEKGGNE